MKTELIKLIVKSNSRNNSIEGFFGSALKIKISAAPEKGNANRELVNFLSKKLNIPKKQVEIVSGFNSPHKIIKIRHESAIDTIDMLI